MPDRKSGKHRRICTACGGRFYIVGRNADDFNRCDACMRSGRPSRAPIQEVVRVAPTEPNPGAEPSTLLTDHNDREVTSRQLAIRLMKGH
jgi:hypothetical protein